MSDLFGSNVYLTLGSAAEWNIWNPGVPDRQSPILNFSGHGFSGMRFSGGVIINESEFLFNYSRPFDHSLNQGNFIEEKQKSGMESLHLIGNKIGKALQAISNFAPDSTVMRTLGSFDVSLTKEKFSGVAQASRNAKLLRYGAQLQPNGSGGYLITNPASAVTDIKAGQKYSFRTEFNDLEATFDLVPLMPNPERLNGLEFRVGGYWAEWSRPAEIGSSVNFTSLGRSFPLVYEAKYRTKGVSMRFEYTSPKNEEDPNSHKGDTTFSLGLRIGVDDDIKTSFPGLLKSSNPQFVGLQASVGHDFRILERFPLYITPTASLDYRNFMERVRDSNGNSVSSGKILDGEKLYKLYARIWTKF